MLTDEQRQTAARELKKNHLLPELMTGLERDLIARWRGSSTPEQREEAWNGLRQLDTLAGAINDAIRDSGNGGNPST
jgi:hypothetical protein